MSTATTKYETSETDLLLESDLGFGMEMDSSTEMSPVTFAPRPKSAPAPVTGPPPPSHDIPQSPRSRVLPRLLAMADAYLRAGSIRQALDMYFDLCRNHSDTPEAILAENRILDAARIHEENGEFHLARAIYEQMI